jgi:hypothetical protein
MGAAERMPEGTGRFFNPVTRKIRHAKDFHAEPTHTLADSTTISKEIIEVFTIGEGMSEDWWEHPMSAEEFELEDGVVNEATASMTTTTAETFSDGVKHHTIETALVEKVDKNSDSIMDEALADSAGSAGTTNSKIPTHKYKLGERQRPVLLASVGRGKGASWKKGVPQSLSQARHHADSGWWEAAEAEMNGHLKKETYEIIDLTEVPKGRSLVDTMFLFDLKRNDRKKGRWVVRGDRQIAGIDYTTPWTRAVYP